LTGTKREQYSEALQQQKHSDISESDFNLYGLLPEEDDDEYEIDDLNRFVKKQKKAKEVKGVHVHRSTSTDKTKGRFPPPCLRRQYYDPNTYTPLCELGATRDLENDKCMRWQVDLSNQYLDEFEDVSFEEKEFFKMWNIHMEVDMGGFYSKKYLPWYCHQFIENYGLQILRKKLRFQVLVHFLYLIDIKMLRKEVKRTLLILTKFYPRLVLTKSVLSVSQFPIELSY
jgi:hypothetical protein